MTLPLDFHRSVRTGLDEAYRWYESRRTGSGRRFLDGVGATFDKIQAQPEQYGVVEDDIRAVPVGRTAYLVYYRVRPTVIEVLAVYHGSRDPAGWQSRA